MSDGLDPQLQRYFAAAEASLDRAPFIAQAELRLQSARRVRWMLRWAAVIVSLALAAAVGPYVVSASVALNHYLATFLLSPWGWGASIVAGMWIVRRARRLALG
jgi:hypothetical protein